MDAVQKRVWIERGVVSPPRDREAFESGLGIYPLTAQTLRLRGVDTLENGQDFLSGRLDSLPDPFLLRGMAAAVARLARAIDRREKIAVHGDYDVDGISGTALLVECLRAFGAEIDYFIPLRLKDGYGLSAEGLQQAASAGAKVVVSVDCGVSAHEEASLAAALGIDLVITDHHQVPETLPDACALINPHQPGCAFPFKDLAGVGVAFFLTVALRKHLREQGAFARRPEPDLRLCLDLVALGTIADIVPLVGVNRLLTRFGLKALETSRRPGLRALREVAAVDQIDSGAVGFRLAPRLNAAGRLEDAALGVELLLETSLERAGTMARMLDAFNQERRTIEQQTYRQAVSRLEAGEGGERSIVLADERWHPGVIGIVASRLVERYHRPTVLIALDNGTGKGSARSIANFHLYRSLQICREHLTGFGGHAFAAGLSIEPSQVERFAAAFDAVALAEMSNEDLIATLSHDGEVSLPDLTLETLQDLTQLAPFGSGNPEPSFVVRSVRVRQIQVLKEHHLRFTAVQGSESLPCIAFGMAERKEELRGEVDLLFTPGINVWKGRSSVQLRIRDLKSADAISPASQVAAMC